MHFNGANSYLFVTGAKIRNFKGKDSEMKRIPLCLGNFPKDFTVDNMINTRFYGYVYDFL